MFYKGIIFDLDNTLYDYDICHKQALTSVFQYIQMRIGNRPDIQLIYDFISNNLKNELGGTASSHNKNIYFKQLLEQLNISLDVLIVINNLYWETFFENMVLFEGVYDFISWNRGLGIKIGVLTDYETEYQIKKLDKVGILGFINEIVTSEEVGIEKPSIQMFQTILKKMDLHSDEVIMFGDNFVKDIQGAMTAGIFAYWFVSPARRDVIKDYYYNDFNSFVSLHTDFISIHDELSRFESLSKFCGERFDLVQAGGGNTSVKHREWMFIKSSGINMSNITPFNGYSVINNCSIMDDISSNNTKDIMSYNVIGKKRGSIETFMHSFLQKYTVHLHPIQTNRILISKDAIEVIRRLFPYALCIDYFTPGIILCNEIRQNYNNEKVIFLKNHGIIITSNDYDEIYVLLRTVIETCEKYENINFDKYRVTNHISGYIFENYHERVVSYLCHHHIIMEYLHNQPELFEQDITFPDALIYCGCKILFIRDGLDEMNAFFISYNELPKIIVYNGYLYITSKTLTKCREIEDVLLSHLMISDTLYEKQYLSKEETDYLTNWDAEKYRKNL